ncbi:hypothetical protein Pa4123_39850 [Phytohabitans aurantiacus]|uniref:Uncharacterized protein n=2 Tax=Phytohabitans aurantiacus TaxID=3016789 RepID=A0ABQ5QVX3_9ACTN|nr:hypothetical protein Pa4123_39850 [Phytohabitans aurantiacus]
MEVWGRMDEVQDNRDVPPPRDQLDRVARRRRVQRRNGRWAGAGIVVIDNRGRNGGSLGDGG